MLGFSFTKIIVLVAVVAAVWYGFKYIERLQRIDKGDRRPTERSIGERLRKAARSKSGPHQGSGDPDVIEDTEKCRKCGVYISVDANSNCGKPGCPY